MRRRFLVLAALALAPAGAGGALAHGGQGYPVPKGCRIVLDPVVVNGVETVIERVVCPAPRETPTS